MIDVARIDSHLAFLDTEIRNLRERSEMWARSKAEKFERMRQDFQRIRQDAQMRGMNGERIDG